MTTNETDHDPYFVARPDPPPNGTFTPVEPSLYQESPQNIGRRSELYVEAMTGLIRIRDPPQFANSWGYLVFRTDYSSPNSDINFRKAMNRLDSYAQNWLFADLDRRHHEDPPPPMICEVQDRLWNVAVEHREFLEDLTIEELGRHFDGWNEFHSTPEEFHRTPKDGAPYSPRFWYCIMMDKESIDNILTLPENPDDVQASDPSKPWHNDVWYPWVKVVTNEVRDGKRLWLRMGVYDVLWEHWFMAIVHLNVCDFEEMTGDYPEDGVLNLYGPPTSLDPFMMGPRPRLTDAWSGHPERELVVPEEYERLWP